MLFLMCMIISMHVNSLEGLLEAMFAVCMPPLLCVLPAHVTCQLLLNDFSTCTQLKLDPALLLPGHHHHNNTVIASWLSSCLFSNALGMPSSCQHRWAATWNCKKSGSKLSMNAHANFLTSISIISLYVYWWNGHENRIMSFPFLGARHVLHMH